MVTVVAALLASRRFAFYRIRREWRIDDCNRKRWKVLAGGRKVR